ncbi:MAG: phosphoglycolate phosphatase [Pseudomonadota bacterium]|nr:phosphoglycolate phosphatase [Pseudomonadota bacterium]
MANLSSRNLTTKFKGVVFDLDGTLIDTLPDILAALNKIMVGEGLREIRAEEGKTFIGGGAYNLIEQAFSAIGIDPEDPKIETAFQQFLINYEKDPTSRSRFYPGVQDFLRTLQLSGIKMGVCTNKPVGLTRKIISKMAIDHYFEDAILGGDSLDIRKPNPQHLVGVIELMGLRPNNVIMVGDSETDIKAARGAGVPIVVVDYGYTSIPHDLLGADALISSFFELPDVMRNLEA